MKGLHPSQSQIEEYISGNCGFFTSLGIRFHLHHCAVCQWKVNEIRASIEEQTAFSAEIKRYHDAERETEETLKTMTNRKGQFMQ